MQDEYTVMLKFVRRNNFMVLTFIAIHAIIASWLVVVFANVTYTPLYASFFLWCTSVYLLMRLEMEVFDMALYSKPDRPIITAKDVQDLFVNCDVAFPLEDHMALVYFYSAKALFAVEVEHIDSEYIITVQGMKFQNLSRICGDFKRLGFDLESCPVSICNVRDCAGVIAYVPRRYMTIRQVYK
jgi:hypothetical protein